METVRASKSPTTVLTANGEVLTKEEGNSVRQRIGFVRDSNATWRYTSHGTSSINNKWEYEWGSTRKHRARALLPHLSWILSSASTNPAEIYDHSWVALWLSADPLQGMNPNSLLRTRITRISPKRSSSLNTKIYVPNPCPSTNWSQRRPTIQRKARDTAPESDLDDEQLRALLASPLYLQEREASAERSQVHHSERENLMSSSSQDPISTGKPVALFSAKIGWIKKRFPIEWIFPQDINRFLGSNESFFRFSDATKARSELMKQECEVVSLNTCISKFQQQSCAQRLELEDAHLRTCRISRASTTTRRIGHERENTSRYSDWKYSRNGRIEESSGITSWRILCTTIERKVMIWFRSSLHRYKSCKRGWIARVIQENFKR